jgi:hypothetical protein
MQRRFGRSRPSSEVDVIHDIVEIRVLPPFAIGRLGSSPDPMDNYDILITDPIATREIRAADTFLVDPDTTEISLRRAPFDVCFRDAQRNIRPVAPFLEVWALVSGRTDLVPLTTDLLAAAGLTLDAVRWSVHVGNRKAFRRTADPNDIVDAQTGSFGDHAPHALTGTCPNFVENASIPFGHVQFVKPSVEFPEIRLRFTPAAGRVYGSVPQEGESTAGLAGIVYDPTKGHWKGFVEPSDLKADPIGVRKNTNPAQVFDGTTKGDSWVSLGYFDDECDGLVDVSLTTPGGVLTAYARISAGPPPFSPDTLPVRTVGDELEQALFGPDFQGPVTEQDMSEVRDIVRRALETVRLVNTAQMNQATLSANVGMARDDSVNWDRALEPIVEPALADALAIRTRHERVLTALESGSLAWFARVLRHYDEVGDLSTAARRKMPALMRGADGNHLALTRRQVSKVQAAAEYARVLIGGTRE